MCKELKNLKLFNIILLLSFFSSYSQNKFPRKKYVFGVVQTCITDSSSFFNKDSIIIELGERDVNLNCPNRPKFSSCCAPWPTYISFSFDDKVISVDTNMELKYKENTDIIESLSIIPRYGKFKMTKNKKQIEITFEKYNWIRKFNVSYNKSMQLLILTKI